MFIKQLKKKKSDSSPTAILKKFFKLVPSDKYFSSFKDYTHREIVQALLSIQQASFNQLLMQSKLVCVNAMFRSDHGQSFAKGKKKTANHQTSKQ